MKVDIWPSVLEDIRKNVGEQRFSLWFQNLHLLRVEGNTITLGVPNLFVREWLQTHFLDVLREALAKHVGESPAVEFRIDPELFRNARKQQLEAGAALVAEAASRAGTPARPQTHIRPDFTFQNFVIGGSNKLAHACALEILESQSNRLHPLFIHSLSGLGKTHLLQGIWHGLLQRNDGRKAEYVSAETFTNQFVYAMRNRRLDAFRNRYRNADVLLIDDVHFWSNKSGLQEEFLHTFDALDIGNRQLVLASDVHPKMLTRIKQNLVSRFASGMVVRLGRPDFATRVGILKAKVHQQRRRVPEEVLRYVARGFEGSTRELSGAITSILAYASLTGAKVDTALARMALSRLGRPHTGTSRLEAVEVVVARYYGLKPGALRGRRMTRSMRFARQVCMYLARQCTPMSCREVARHFGARQHSTVVFSVKRVREEMKKDRDIAELVAALAEEIKRT